jgi:endonuclease-3
MVTVGCRRASRVRPETRTGLVRRARKIDRTLAETYPDARIELDFDDPFQLLVVTVLSAQTTDQARQRRPPDPLRRLPRRRRDGGRPARAPRADHRPARLLPGQDRLTAQAQRRPRRAVRRRGPARRSPTWSRSRASAARPPTSSSATASTSPASPSTPTSAASPAASAGPTRPTRSRSSTPSGRSSRSATGTMLCHHLIWHGRRICHAKQAGVRCVPGRALVPGVRRGPGRPGRRRRSWSAPRGRHETRPRSWPTGSAAAVLAAGGVAGRALRPGPDLGDLARATLSTSTPPTCRVPRSRAGHARLPEGAVDGAVGGDARA